MEIMDEDAKDARITSLQEKRARLRQQFVSLDEEHALVENELACLQDSPGVGLCGRSRVAMEERTTCNHSCAYHIALMDPAILSSLPSEVLQMVFARLPLHQVISLQCLSKAWRWNVTAKESGFRRLCASADSSNPKMFALVDEGTREEGAVSVRLFDVQSQRWHAFETTLQPQLQMLACDGGLVFFVSRVQDKVKTPLVIMVLNPFTKEYKVLPVPCSSLKKMQPTMVQLLVDRDTKCYKVTVVGEEQRRTGAFLVKVYDSATRSWSNLNSTSDLVFGYHFRWTPDGDEELAGDRVGPCIYDYSKAQLLKFGEHDNPALASCKGYALLRDHLFVLHHEIRNRRCAPEVEGDMDVSRFFISEYKGQKGSPHWVRLKVHECTPLKRPFGCLRLSYNWHMVLHACTGFLMVAASYDEFGPFKLKRTWLLDFSTYEWHELPAAPRGEDSDYEPRIQEAMCELHWDAVP